MTDNTALRSDLGTYGVNSVERIPAADAERHLVRITPKRPLPLVNLKDD